MKVKEEFLQYVWQSSLYHRDQLSTFDGRPVQVMMPGMLNRDAGPDFFNAKVVIDNILWVGNVEIHTTSSEWMQHGHQFDAAYNNVVLHVVYEHDEEIVNQMGKVIPTLELRSIIPSSVIARYNGLNSGVKWIACENMLDEIDFEKVNPFIHRLFVERWQDKTRFMLQDLSQNGNNWERTFYEYMARNFGFKVNALPFHILAKGLPLQVLAKHKLSLFQLEALLFGQAGFLQDNFEESYPNELKREYGYLKKVHQLDPINMSLWKFATMRPANFPTVRLAQFAQLIHHSSSLFSRCMEIKTINELEDLMEFDLSIYWQTHYQFDKPTANNSKKIGRSSVENIFMNTIGPFMFAYGKAKQNDMLCERSIHMMEELSAEKNGIITRWQAHGFNIENAYQSQAFIQLKNMYCTPKKCLSCSIGNQVLKR